MSHTCQVISGVEFSEENERRERFLEAAVSVFARHGYRKASMDQVARAADLSRQGLYLHFPSKEVLFRDTIRWVLCRGLRRASEALRAEGRTLEQRLVDAFDAYYGPCLDGSHELDELLNEDCRLVGELVEELRESFTRIMAETLEGSSLMETYRRCELTGADLASILMATANGLKLRAASRAEFVIGFEKAVRALTCGR